jgi:hypothetical protein
MDALKSVPHSSHFSYQESLDHLQELLPDHGRGYFTGLTHELDHEELNNWIQKHQKRSNLHIECGYDGQKIQIEDEVL